jgi:hypothetical protein
MIVMYHKFGYELDGVKKQIDSKMVHWRRPNLYCNGKDSWIAGCNGDLQILNENYHSVQLPIRKEVYLPILKE